MKVFFVKGNKDNTIEDVVRLSNIYEDKLNKIDDNFGTM